MDMEDRIRELVGIGVEEGISARGDSATALRLASLVFGKPASIFLRDNGDYAARFTDADVVVSVEFDGRYGIKGTILPAPRTPSQPQKGEK